MNITPEMIITVIGSIVGGGGIGAYIKAKADSKKTGVESAMEQSESIINRWKELESHADDRSKDLERKTEELSKKVDVLTEEVSQLRAEMDDIQSEYKSLESDYASMSRYATQLEGIIQKLNPDYILPIRPVTRHSIS